MTGLEVIVGVGAVAVAGLSVVFLNALAQLREDFDRLFSTNEIALSHIDDLYRDQRTVLGVVDAAITNHACEVTANQIELAARIDDVEEMVFDAP